MKGGWTMDAIQVPLLDLCPDSGLREEIKAILDSCKSPPFQVRIQSISPEESDLFRKISSFLEENPAEIIFVLLPPKGIQPARSIIPWLKKKKPDPQILAVLEGNNSEEAIELLMMGVEDFIAPPLKATDVLPRIWRIRERKTHDQMLLHALKTKIGLTQLVGRSPAFQMEMDKIPLVAKCDASVLISGETGTGKELFARAIHYLSNRTGKPFVPVSCGAIPVELVENELFGHMRGAFTGAATSQTGLVGEAEGGTLFLDDIDCLPLMSQMKVLRLLQEKEYKQLGSTRYYHADVRVIAAANVDLEKTMKEAKFRQDLFYRLNIIPLALPPLRERPEDIPLLARHFLGKYAFEFKKENKDLGAEAMQKLLLYDWPGNVRELENVMERAVVFSRHPILQEADIQLPPSGLPALEPFKKAKIRAMEQFEKRYIQGLLLANRGNITHAARAADKNRRAFWELIRKYKIDVRTYKPHPLGETG
jgi:two-component system, NtrC family, response regulator GlrR